MGDEGLPSRSHRHQKSCHPLRAHPPGQSPHSCVSETPTCLGLLGLSAPAPHQSPPPRSLRPVHTDLSPPAVCLGSQPPTCHGAVPPPPPLPPGVCPLLSEQVDSDAQSHKPWVGMKFLSFSHRPSPAFWPLLPHPCTPPSLVLPMLPSFISLLYSAFTPEFPR